MPANRRRFPVCIPAVWLLAAAASAAEPVAPPAPEPGLTDPAGRIVRLSEIRSRPGTRAVVVVFVSAECPMSNAYLPALAGLHRDLGPKGVAFVAVHSGETDPARAAAHAHEYRVPFPVLLDRRGALAGSLGAKVTPEAFVLSAADGAVLYRGAIDDGYAGRLVRREAVTREHLKSALEAVLAGKKPEPAAVEAFGCAVAARPAAGAKAPPAGAPTFHRDVQPLLQKHCQSCHRPGQVAPFELMTYDDARRWADDLKDYTARRAMPPWKPAAGGRELIGDRSLTDAEIAVFAKWADAGAPRGEPADAPAPAKFPDGWALGEPDLVLEMPEPFELSAEGRDVFRCFVFPTAFADERFVTAIEVRPGNSRVVHHALLAADTRGKARELDARDPKPGYDPGLGFGFLPVDGGLGGWAPGNTPHHVPDGAGRRLPAGADVVLQIHYHKSGKPETDRTRVGLYLAKGPVAKVEKTVPVACRGIRIPAGAASHVVRAESFVLPKDLTVLGATPHMHLLGRRMTITATTPDGKTTELLRIDDWDFNWQESYYFREPLRLPKGTRIDVEAVYDNSAANPHNPSNPPKPVTWGEQTTNEMCIGFVHFADEASDRRPLKEIPLVFRLLLD